MSAAPPVLSLQTQPAGAGGRTALLRLERPDAMNAFSSQLVAELERAVASLEKDRDVRALVLTGAGRAFSAGADLKERATMNRTEVEEFLTRVGRLFRIVETLPFPTIASINGFAFGGGLELALCFDLRIAARSAQLGLTETSLGIIPGAGGTQRLARAIGVPRAKEMILTARRISAERALELELVHEVVEDGALEERASALALEVTRNAPIALAAAKWAIDSGRHLPLDEALAVERTAYARTLDTKDRVEALAAFREKRPPIFTGE